MLNMSGKGEEDEKFKAEEPIPVVSFSSDLDNIDILECKIPQDSDEGVFYGFDYDQERNRLRNEYPPIENTKCDFRALNHSKIILNPCTPEGSKLKTQKCNKSPNDFMTAKEEQKDESDALCTIAASLPEVEDPDLKCPMCGHVSTSLTDLDVHLRSHPEKALHKCPLCDKSFITESYLKEHSLDHGEDRVYKCAWCEFSTKVRGTFYTHALIHIGVRPHKCSHCGQCFRTHSHLKNHLRRHTGEKPYQCPKCDYRAGARNTLKAHLLAKVHNDNKPYKCSVCPAKFSDRRHLLSHVIAHSEDRPYSCSTCGKSFKTNPALTSHKALHKNDSVYYSCSYCEYKTKYKARVKEHERSHTGDQSHKKFVCHLCGLRTDKKYLKTHLKIHSEERNYKCERCDFRGKTKCALYNHSQLHEGKIFSCSECPKEFRSKKSLKIHFLQWHTNECRLQCSMCDYRTVEKKKLIAHIRSHTGERPFHCDICNMTFKTSAVLRKHTENHNKEKIKCSQCSYKSKYLGNLKHHIRIKHENVRQFKCSVCPQTFIAKNPLVAHMVQHSGERPYKCHLCDYTGIEERSLRAHIATHDRKRMNKASSRVKTDLKCSVCPFFARGKVHFRKHLLLHVKNSYVKLFKLEFKLK